MAGSGRISLLIDSPLRTVNLAFRGLDAEVRKQISRFVKSDSLPIWQDETRGHALSKMQQRVLAGTSKVGISGLAVRLSAGGGGRLSSGTPTGDVAPATFFGANASKLQSIPSHSRKGHPVKAHTRRLGGRFPLPGRGGFNPAVRAAIPRVGALVVQTTIRTVHELRERLGK